jgi:hypothetical protein
MLPMMPNPMAVVIKKYLFEMLKEKYAKNERLIERLAQMLVTREDYESFGSLMGDLYESGFLRATDQYREQLSKMGLKVDVVAEERPREGKKIFKD